MDYDDNDYHSQNLQLAGEESSKISAVLNPYVLPKFDFDDNLQGHLRFDSLVENEVYLGIPSQEDNRWIEDFSRGSSGTESCTITRHNNNVWSEATSSESVEMLLKSVRQGEMVPGETIIEESDASDELGSLTKQMEPNSNQDDRLKDVIDPQTALPPDAEISVEAQTAEIAVSADESSRELDPDAVSEKIELIVTKENLKCDDSNQSGVGDTSANIPLNNKIQAHPSGFGIRICNIDSPSQNVISNAGELNDEDNEHGLSKDACEGADKHNVPSQEVKMDEQLLSTIAHQERKLDSPMQITHEQSSSIEENVNFLRSDDQIYKGDFLSNFEQSILSRAENKSLKREDESSNKHLGDLASVMVSCSSAEMLGEKQAADEDVSMHESGNEKLPTDSSELKSEVVESSSSGEVMEENIAIAHGSESNTMTTATMNRPSLDVVVGGTNLTSYETYDDAVVSISVNGSASGVDSNEEQTQPVPGVGSTHLDKKEKLGIEVPRNTSLLLLKESSQVASDVGCVSEVERGESCDCAAEKLHGMVDQSVSEVANEVGQKCSEKMELCHVSCDSSIKEGDRVEAIAIENYKETTVERNHEVASLEVAEVLKKSEVVIETTIASLVEPCSDMGQENRDDNETIVASGVNNPDQAVPNTKVDTSDDHQASVGLVHSSESNADRMLKDGAKSADSDKAKCDSPTVINCIDLSQSEEHKQEETKGAMVENVSLSESTGGVDAKVQSISPHLTGNDNSKEDGNFTFEVNPLVDVPVGEIGKCWQSFPAIQGCKTSTTVEGSPSTSGGGQMDAKIVKQISSRSPQAYDGGIPHGGAKVNPGRKTRRGSGRAAGRENPKKGNHFKETTPVGQLERGDKSCGVISLPASDLPDLNTSVPPSAVFQQPLTDVQQVQLGAQIFVYGSLIQGAAPYEACMVSAFGPSDDTRSVWEPVWRACLERLHGQKSHANNCGSPAPSHSGSKTPDQAIKHGSLASSVFSSPVARASSKGTPSAVVNSMIPLSLPPWNISAPSCDGLQSLGVSRSPILDYHQSLSPLHLYQNLPVQNLIGHNASWLSQASFPGPWVASAQTSSSDISARFSGFPFTEPVKLSPVKESSMHFLSNSQHVSPIPAAHSGPPNVSVCTSLLDMKKVTASPGQRSADPKARKRKRASVTEIESLSDHVGSHLTKKVPVTIGKISLLAQSRTVLASAPASHFSTSVAVTTDACSASKRNLAKFPSALGPTCSSSNPKREEHNVENKVIKSKETSSEVEETELDANAASTHAAAAVSHCQDVWNQLTKQKNSGLVLELEAKLASMTATIAASASVAKAAAAAAKIALNAAVQAKLMADEALVSSETGNPIPSTTNSLPNAVNTLGKGIGSSSSSLIIFTAREAARRRVEAASVASKHAENLDAIVKAAELAAEAVSLAGKIVANSVEEVPYVSAKQLDGESSPMEGCATNHDMPPRPREIPRNRIEDHMRVVDGISIASSEHDSRGKKCHKGSELGKTAQVVPESEFGLRSTFVTAQNVCDNATGSSKENNIRVGCLVEVLRDGGNHKAAWFSANILGLMDGKALVCYTELQSDEGPGQLTEWVPLEDISSKAPRIRIPYSIIAMGFEGKKKRHRGAMTDYVWSIGDRVDAWMQNCWHEGVVTEKMDETTVTVHFPDQRETSVVRAWHLRPTLVWKEGEWIEWSSSRGECSSQGDTPQGRKRVNRGIPVSEGKGMDKMSMSINLVESGKHKASRLLPLSAHEKVFTVDKNTGAGENEVGALRTMRSDQTKEGLGVIFGVPKPGKKTKFMEVSKHFVSERGSKNNSANDSVFGKYMISQGSRGWKTSSKIDAKDEQAAEPKAKVVKRGRTLLKQNHLSTNSVPNDDTATDHIVNNENKPGLQKSTEYRVCSNTEEAAQGPILYSSLALPSNASKKIPSSMAKSKRLNKGKVTLAGGNSTKVEVVDKSVTEGVEPRRSNRRILPTSRLLEGLQSSLTVSKLSAVSHDKSHMGQNGATSTGSNHG